MIVSRYLCGTGTVQRMVGDFDAAAAIHNGIPDRAEAWDFIRAFVAGWCTPLTDADGIGEEELKRAESQLSPALPAALGEAYLLFGRRSDLFEHQDPMLPPSESSCTRTLGVCCASAARTRGVHSGACVWPTWKRLTRLSSSSPVRGDSRSWTGSRWRVWS